jgi:hypothetical protein
MWTMTARRDGLDGKDWSYDRPLSMGLGVVGAAWVVTLTFLILMLFA